MDTLIRYHRMKGFDTLWQVGTDHAGIATEMVVSRNLAAEGKGETRDSLGREAFIEKVWEWKHESGNTITRQMRRMGASGDWSRERFTMDEGLSKAVTETFVRLFEEGLIYRGQRLVNWDPVLKTAISDLEVVSEEEDGSLWSIFRSEEHTSELQSLMRISYAVFCLKKNTQWENLTLYIPFMTAEWHMRSDSE